MHRLLVTILVSGAVCGPALARSPFDIKQERKQIQQEIADAKLCREWINVTVRTRPDIIEFADCMAKLGHEQ